MPKICYIDKNFRSATMEIIYNANDIIEHYQAQGYDLTLRQLFYQFVSKDLLDNTQPGGQAPDNGFWLGDVTSGYGELKCGGHYENSLHGDRNTLDATGGFGECLTASSDPNNLRSVRDTAQSMMATMGYTYRLTSDADIKTRGDAMFGYTFGGTGPFHASWSFREAGNPQRNHNMALTSDSYLVDRLSEADASTTAQNRTLSIAGNIASVTNAAKMRATLTLPSGATAANTCASSPCAVTADAQQGRHRLVVEYLSSGDAVLARSDPQIVTP